MFSWDHCKSQEKLETMQNLGAQTKSIMVFSEVAYPLDVGLHCDREGGRASLNSNNSLGLRTAEVEVSVIFPFMYFAASTYFSAFSFH